MGEEFSESDLQRVKDLEPQTSRQHTPTESVGSPENEEEKNDGIEQAAIQDEASLSVPSIESPLSEDLQSTSNSSEEAAVVKWDSPASTTTEPEAGSSPFDSGQETSPDNQDIRPTTVTSRSLKMSKLRDIGKKFFEDAPNKIKEMFNSVLPRKDFMDSSGSSFYGEGSSGETLTSQPQLLTRTPLHLEVTSQAGGLAINSLGNFFNGPRTPENGSAFLFNNSGNLLAIQSPAVSNGKASTGEISSLKDDHSSPKKKPKLQIEEEAARGDESSDTESSRDEVNTSPMEKTESETEEAD